LYLISGVVLCCVRNISDLFEDCEHFADTDRPHIPLHRITFICIVSHLSVSYHIPLYRITFICIVSHSSVSYHIHLYRITFICIVSHSSVSYHIPLYLITFICIVSHSSVSYHIPLYRITDHSSHITHIDFKVYTGNLGRKGESKVIR
jgi:hypothetical protein